MQFLVAGGLFVLYWFVARPGFYNIVGGDNPLAGVIGLSLLYFIVAGLVQAYAFDPLFVYLFVKQVSEAGFGNRSEQDREDMILFGKGLYWSVIFTMYFLVVKPSLKSKYEAKPKVEAS